MLCCALDSVEEVTEKIGAKHKSLARTGAQRTGSGARLVNGVHGRDTWGQQSRWSRAPETEGSLGPHGY